MALESVQQVDPRFTFLDPAGGVADNVQLTPPKRGDVVLWVSRTVNMSASEVTVADRHPVGTL